MSEIAFWIWCLVFVVFFMLLGVCMVTLLWE